MNARLFMAVFSTALIAESKGCQADVKSSASVSCSRAPPSDCLRKGNTCLATTSTCPVLNTKNYYILSSCTFTLQRCPAGYTFSSSQCQCVCSISPPRLAKTDSACRASKTVPHKTEPYLYYSFDGCSYTMKQCPIAQRYDESKCGCVCIQSPPGDADVTNVCRAPTNGAAAKWPHKTIDTNYWALQSDNCTYKSFECSTNKVFVPGNTCDCACDPTKTQADADTSKRCYDSSSSKYREASQSSPTGFWAIGLDNCTYDASISECPDGQIYDQARCRCVCKARPADASVDRCSSLGVTYVSTVSKMAAYPLTSINCFDDENMVSCLSNQIFDLATCRCVFTCKAAIDCSGNGACNETDGYCDCFEGFTLSNCSVCAVGYNGPSCECNDVKSCNSRGTCQADGTCACDSPYAGTDCLDCIPGLQGALCDETIYAFYDNGAAFDYNSAVALCASKPDTPNIAVPKGSQFKADWDVLQLPIQAFSYTRIGLRKSSGVWKWADGTTLTAGQGYDSILTSGTSSDCISYNPGLTFSSHCSRIYQSIFTIQGVLCMPSDCPPGTDGPGCTCTDAGTCNNNGFCMQDGTCVCKTGFTGANCNSCAPEYKGENCTSRYTFHDIGAGGAPYANVKNLCSGDPDFPNVAIHAGGNLHKVIWDNLMQPLVGVRAYTYIGLTQEGSTFYWLNRETLQLGQGFDELLSRGANNGCVRISFTEIIIDNCIWWLWFQQWASRGIICMAPDCDAGLNGPSCQYSNAATCSDNGIAQIDGTCFCDDGWTGAACSTCSQC